MSRADVRVYDRRARNTSQHEIVEVRAGESRFGALFEATRKASAEAGPDEPVVLLLLEPHNPTAITMNVKRSRSSMLL